MTCLPILLILAVAALSAIVLRDAESRFRGDK